MCCVCVAELSYLSPSPCWSLHCGFHSWSKTSHWVCWLQLPWQRLKGVNKHCVSNTGNRKKKKTAHKQQLWRTRRTHKWDTGHCECCCLARQPRGTEGNVQIEPPCQQLMCQCDCCTSGHGLQHLKQKTLDLLCCCKQQYHLQRHPQTAKLWEDDALTRYHPVQPAWSITLLGCSICPPASEQLESNTSWLAHLISELFHRLIKLFLTLRPAALIGLITGANQCCRSETLHLYSLTVAH